MVSQSQKLRFDLYKGDVVSDNVVTLMKITSIEEGLALNALLA